MLVTVVTTGEHAALADVPEPPPAEQGWVLVIVVTPGDKVDTTVDVNAEKLCVVATVVCVTSDDEHAAAILVRVQKQKTLQVPSRLLEIGNSHGQDVGARCMNRTLASFLFFYFAVMR